MSALRDTFDRPWHAGRVLFALARHFDWWHNPMLPEFELDGGRCDLVIISAAGYATEIEIKVSLADWKRDKLKQKFTAPREHVARVFYAVPDTLIDCMTPDLVFSLLPVGAGILRVAGSRDGYDTVREMKAAKRMKAKRVPEKTIEAFQRAFYYRFWRQHMDLERIRLFARPRTTQLERAA